MHHSSYPIPVQIPELRFFQHNEPFQLEAGGVLPQLTVAYHTYGSLNAEGTNVIWVCHALTANSNVADWWAGIFGPGRVLDPERYFIVCANIIGSCYGSTCPRSISPETRRAYGTDFPIVTIRDMVNAHELLRKKLNINEIALCIGGSCGGHQVMEFAYLLQEKMKKMALLVTSARETAWAIAIHEAQRMAIQADPTWRNDEDRAGNEGMKAARGFGLVGYRTFDAYTHDQTDADDKLNEFRAATYIRHQGDKLDRRFYAQCYWHLTKSLDTHHIGRDRGGAEQALRQLNTPAFVLSIDSDVLIPPSEQRFLAENIPNSTYEMLHSPYGHDGFLIETEAIGNLILDWL
ncbi:MAG TPA: homoserine O-acetyltransferase [Saprospiraceae bacterium]|nr:homoserine O-acetyltransferase [Saprospiraceae bacterium]